MLYQIGGYWNYSQFHRIAAYYLYVENKNGDQKVYDETKSTIYFVATMAFPSVKRVLRFVDRFADSAFTKDPG
jgi:hypothetical protein